MSAPTEAAVQPRTSAWRSFVRRRPDFTFVILAIVTVFLYLYMFLPIAIIVALSFSTNEMAVLPIRDFTFQWYEEAWGSAFITNGLRTSLALAALVVVASVTLGFLAAYALARFRFRGKGAFTALVSLPVMIPRLVLGVTLLAFFGFLSIQLSFWSILVGHVVIAVPLTTLVILTRLQDIDPALDEAAWDLGAGWFTRMRTITLPLLAPAVLAAALLAFTVSFDDVVIALFTSAMEPTLPMVLYSMVTSGFSQTVNAVGATVMAATFTIVFLSQVLLRRQRVS
jgi:spermidine/putrescine transport system permease protein